jgi:outer membrane protein insertion porin family
MNGGEHPTSNFQCRTCRGGANPRPVRPPMVDVECSAILAMLLWLLAGILVTHAAEDNNSKPATLKISGYGLLGDLQLKRLVKLMEFPNRNPAYLDANFIEDSALILMSKLQDDGHLDAFVAAEITLEDGHNLKHVWHRAVEEPLPRPIRAREVRFEIHEGVLYHYAQLAFQGLTAIPENRSRSYFIETSGLIPLKRNRVYSPGRLKRSVSNLQEALNRLGFQGANVTATNLVRNDHNGAVSVSIVVQQGPKSMVHSVRQEVYFADAVAPVDLRTNDLLRPYSKFWEQDFTHSIKTNYYHRGYPETSVEMQTVKSELTNNLIFLDMLARVKPGPRVRVGKVNFEGARRTRLGFLHHQVPVKPGEWLDRVQAEEGRYRLSRLGVFDSVELGYSLPDTNTWDVNYELKEGKRVDVSLIFGFGSYDLLRGGIEINQYNLWGLAHNQRVSFIQSFKSSMGDYTYTIPELLGENADVFMKASALRREEISFVRLEYGGGAGVHKRFPRSGADVTVRYNYGILQATADSINFQQTGAQSPTVGEIIGDVRLDRRDNPLFPHKGYELLGNVEIADDHLGGEADFQRVEVGGSWHISVNDSEWIHLGLKHGVVATLGGSSQTLPFARRFFPGGENSVRGFQEGEAAPRDVNGNIVGAETYLTGNVEFEQALTPKWSIVGFVDGVGFAQSLKDYPEDHALFSAGGGLRWRTLVGPVRLEYGYNLNPRPRDPMGTLQFSLGFPF